MANEPRITEAEVHRQLGQLAHDALELQDPASITRRAIDLLDKAEGVGPAWPSWFADFIEKSDSPDRAVLGQRCRLYVGDQYGQVIGLFTEGDRSLSERVAVGQPAQPPKLTPMTLASFASARNAVGRLLEQEACLQDGELAGSPSLQEIKPALPGQSEEVFDQSAGLAYALAMVSRLMQLRLRPADHGVGTAFRISPAIAVTGAIADDGRVAAIAGAWAKIGAAAADLPPLPNRAVLLPFEDAAALPGPAPILLRPIATLRDAVPFAFPDLIDPFQTLAALGLELQGEMASRGSPRAQKVLGPIRANPVFAAGVSFCGGDPLLFLSIASYFAFAIDGHRQSTRAPEDWPSAVFDQVRIGGGEDSEFVNGVTYARRLAMAADFDGRPDAADRTALADRIADFWRMPTEDIGDKWPAAIVDAGWACRAMRSLPGERGPDDEAYLYYLRRKIGLGHLLPNETRPSPYASFEAILAILAPRHAKHFRDLLGRRITIEAIDAKGVDTLSAVEDGTVLGFSTLGGAWLVKAAWPSVAELEPYSPRRSLLEAAFGRGTGVSEKLAHGIREGAARTGGLVVLNERIFHPRVLWELAAGSNTRYPAEKVICRIGLNRLARERDLPLRQSWTYDLLPMIADGRTDEKLADNSREVGLGDVKRIGDVFVQDYAAYGRTNGSNKWLKVQSFSDVQEADTDMLSERTLGPALPGLGDFYWRDAAGGTPRIAVVNARTSAVAYSDAIQRHLLLGEILDPAGVPVSELTSQQLLGVAWSSMANGEMAPSLRAHLRGRSGPLFDSRLATGRDRLLPVFWDPFSWRGCGLASTLAYESVVAVKMIQTLADLMAGEPPVDASLPVWSPESASVAVSRLAVFDYVRREYLIELQRMGEVLRRVEGLYRPDVDVSELQDARSIIAEAREWLGTAVDGGDSRGLVDA